MTAHKAIASRKPARRPSGAAREEQLLKRALALFSEVGYHETSLQQIADHLGITRPLFYYYFESKEDLLSKLIGHLGDAMLERVRPALESDGGPLEVLEETFRTHVGVLLENREAFRVYFAERNLGKELRFPHVLKGEEQYMALVTGVVQHGQELGLVRPGNARVVALFATGMLNSVLRWYAPGGALQPDEIGRTASMMALGSLRP